MVGPCDKRPYFQRERLDVVLNQLLTVSSLSYRSGWHLLHELMESGTVHKGWMSRNAEREAKRDVISFPERMGQFIAVAIIIAIALFFWGGQAKGTGFFTSSFDSLDSILFYGVLLFGAIPPLLRLILGRRNVVRPVEIVNAFLVLIAASWFLITFPFDFSQFPSLFPESLRFLVSWISDGLVKLLLVLGIIGSIISIAVSSITYVSVRRILRGQQPLPLGKDT